jgi:hypothetical protein
VGRAKLPDRPRRRPLHTNTSQSTYRDLEATPLKQTVASPAHGLEAPGAAITRRLSGAAGATSLLELDGPIRDRQPEGRPDRPVDEPDFTPVGADQFGCDSKSQSGAAGAG